MANIFTLTGEILLRGAGEAQRDITDVTKTGEQAESRLSKAFKKIGGIIATAFAVDKIKDFGVSIVNASAEVSAEMSAFEQIMGNYSDTAQKKLDEVAKETGVVSTRLTPYMTSLTAKFKGLGNDISTSTDLATRGLLLASDASAFWDKSLDDSMSALNSFINGSYEGGEAIGLFANDTQLAQFAIQQGVVESTKDWSALDEATKQATRLEYAENMMKASGATGQASKEAGQYANVQANLAEAWRQFKAEIGEPLLQNVVIPAMQGLQTVVGTLSDKWKQLTQWISDNKDTINQWIDVLIIAGTMIGTYVLVAGTMSILKTVKTWITSVATAQKLLNLVMGMNPIALVITAIAGLVVAFVKLWNESEAFRNFWKGLWSAIWKEVSPVVQDIKIIFTQLWTGIKAVWNAVSPYFKRLWSSIQSNAKVAIAPIVSTFKLAWSNIKVVWSVAVAYFKTVWNNIKLVFSVVKSVLTGDFRGAWNGIKGIWSNTASFFRTVWNGIKQVFSNVGTWFKDIFKNAKDGIKRVFVDFPSEMLSIGKDIVKGLWNGINDMTGWIVDKVKGFGGDVLGGIKKFFGIKSPSKVFAEIGKFLAEGLGIGIEDNSDYAVEAVEELGEDTKSGFQGMMDNLQDKLSSNPMLRRIGQAFGFEFADGIEEAIPEIEATAEEIPEVVAEAVSENSNVATKSFGEMFKGIADTAQKYTNKAMEYLSGLGSAMYDYQNQMLENEIDAKESEIDALKDATDEKLELAQTEHDEQIQLLKDQYNKGLIDQKAYNAKKEALATALSEKTRAIQEEEKAQEEKLAKERDALQRKQFEAKKRNDIAQVWISFATGTMRAFAENWWPIALAITSALAVQAGVQTATINSQQYTPAYAEGGIVDRATVGLVGEDGREAVVPLERNTEWVGGLARAISPAIVTSSQSSSEDIRSLREELVTIRGMLSEYLSQILSKNTDVVIDGESLAYAIAPSIDANLGSINRMRARGI